MASADLDKTKAAREVAKIRAEIKQQIQSILCMPPPQQQDEPKVKHAHHKGVRVKIAHRRR